jgi:hypothetical protein
MIDFAKLQQRTKANHKGGSPSVKDKDFVWKFRRFETKRGGVPKLMGKFYIGKDMWNELELTTNGLTFLFDKDTKTSFIQVVDEAKALSLKGSESGQKQKSFKADVLEEDCIAAGFIPATGKCEVKLNIEKLTVPGMPELYQVLSDEKELADVDDAQDPAHGESLESKPDDIPEDYDGEWVDGGNEGDMQSEEESLSDVGITEELNETI